MEKENKVTEQNETNFTTELFGIFKKVIAFQWILIVALIVTIIGISVYHEYQWSQFDSVIVDSDGGGYANYVGNDGDVNNYGTNYGSEIEKP